MCIQYGHSYLIFGQFFNNKKGNSLKHQMEKEIIQPMFSLAQLCSYSILHAMFRWSAVIGKFIAYCYPCYKLDP
jgi:hypothetical protein